MSCGDRPLDHDAHIGDSTLCRADEFLPSIAIALLNHGHPCAWGALMRRGQVLLDGYSLVAWSFGLLVAAASSPNSSLARMQVPGMATLAVWSYAVFLVHKPVAFALLTFWLKPQGTTIGSWLAVTVITAASLLPLGRLAAVSRSRDALHAPARPLVARQLPPADA